MPHHGGVPRPRVRRLTSAIGVVGILLAGCALTAVPPPNGEPELTCDGGRLRIAWSLPARLGSIDLIGPDGMLLMNEETEVPPGQPIGRWENSYEWTRNAITPPGDYEVRFAVDGRTSKHSITCP